MTHLHYDHARDLSAFPNAKIYLQDREMAFSTGRHMSHQRMRMVFDVEYGRRELWAEAMLKEPDMLLCPQP